MKQMNFSNINYNLYKSFIAVYENKNISRAAKELFLTQPNLSRNIKELEKYLDVKLFYSHPRGMEPTNEGTELYNKVAPAFAWIDYGEKNIKEFNAASPGVIKIVCATTFAGYALAQSIKSFNAQFPKVQFDLVNAKAADALEVLERRNADLVFSTLPLDQTNTELESIKIWPLEETFYTSKEFAKQHGIKEVISKEQFEKLPLIAHRSLDCAKKSVAIVDTQEMMFQLVKNGFGVGRCLRQFLDYNHPNDEVFRFMVEGDWFIKPNLICVYNKELLTKCASAFLSELRNNLVNVAVTPDKNDLA